MKKKIMTVFFLIITAFAFATSSLIVYVTANGKKYHRKSCSTLSKSRTVISLSIDDARKKGYEPCKKCNP